MADNIPNLQLGDPYQILAEQLRNELLITQAQYQEFIDSVASTSAQVANAILNADYGDSAFNYAPEYGCARF